MDWNPTQNPDCPVASELEGIETLIMDTEVTLIVRSASKQGTRHD